MFFIGIGRLVFTSKCISDSATSAAPRINHYLLGAGSNDYINNYLQPFLADGQQYTPEEFGELLISTLDKQLTVKKHFLEFSFRTAVVFMVFYKQFSHNKPYIMELAYARGYTNWVPEWWPSMALVHLVAFHLRG